MIHTLLILNIHVLLTMPVTSLEFQLTTYLLLRLTTCSTASSLTILRASKQNKATVVRKLIDRDAENHRQLKFLLEIGEGNCNAIITYSELCDLLEQQAEQQDTDDPDTLWTYDDILGHQGPIKPNNPFYKGSSYNVLVKWSNGEESYESQQSRNYRNHSAYVSKRSGSKAIRMIELCMTNCPAKPN